MCRFNDDVCLILPFELDLFPYCSVVTGNVTAATDVVMLELHHINHILTVDSCPLPRKIIMLPGIKTKFLQGEC